MAQSQVVLILGDIPDIVSCQFLAPAVGTLEGKEQLSS